MSICDLNLNIKEAPKNSLSIYVHIPFCNSKCAYCSFVSVVGTEDDKKKYFSDLVNEIKIKSKEYKSHYTVSSIYIGGGTPTILSEEQLEKLLSTVSECYDVSKLEEYTFEGGRPDTISAEKLRIAKKHGVTRVSVNTQSLSDEVLKSIGRDHSADDFFRAYNIAAESGANARFPRTAFNNYRVFYAHYCTLFFLSARRLSRSATRLASSGALIFHIS